jgi:hypothetical protein
VNYGLLCAHCGRIIDGQQRWWFSGAPYHAECVGPPPNPNGPPIYYSPMQPRPGCQPLPQLTEEDVRRIVREELAKRSSNG